MGLLASLLSVSCGAGAFGCTDSDQCVDGSVAGVCQPGGNCSFPADDCPSGQRYAEHSFGGLAGECVPTDGETESASATASSSAGTSATGSGSGSTDPSTTLTTTSTTTTDGSSTGSPVTAVPTSGPTTDATTSDGTAMPETGSDTAAATTATPPEGCELYCDVKTDCNQAQMGCADDCEDGLDLAEDFGDPCKDALEELMDCRSELTCGELSIHLNEPLGEDSSCTSEVFAVGGACPLTGCADVCVATTTCMLDVGEPCEESCSGSTMATLLDGAGPACIQATGDFYACLSPLMCETLSEVLEGGNLVACEEFLPPLIENCP